MAGGRLSESPSLATSDKQVCLQRKKIINTRKKKRRERNQEREENIKAFPKLSLHWKGGNYTVLSSEATCKERIGRAGRVLEWPRSIFLCSEERNTGTKLPVTW